MRPPLSLRYLRGETAVDAAQAEDVRTRLLLAGLQGWEEHDADHRIRFVFYCAEDVNGVAVDDVEHRTREVEAWLGERSVHWSSVDDEDWAHAWKRFWKTQRIGDSLVVKPTWERYQALPADRVIELDPGMAFGSGTHETTRMCMEWLEAIMRGGESVLDVGTGSGILTVAALRLGAVRAIALDNDPVAVQVASGNFALNRVDGRAEARQADGLHGMAERDFDVIVANIVADAIIALAPHLRAHLAPAGRFIGSGIILERVDDVRAALSQGALQDQNWRTEGEWASVCAGV